MKQRKVWSVSCQELDSIVLNRLFELVQQDSDMVERIKAFWKSRKTEEVDEAHVLRQQIKKAQDQIARLDGLLTNPARPLSKATEERYLAMINDAEEWSEEEDSIMRGCYPDKPQIEVMQALPQRAWNRILERAQILKLRRDIVPSLNFNGPHPVNIYHRTVSYGDLEAVAQPVQTEEERNRIRQVANELARKTMRGNQLAY